MRMLLLLEMLMQRKKTPPLPFSKKANKRLSLVFWIFPSPVCVLVCIGVCVSEREGKSYKSSGLLMSADRENLLGHS